MTAPPRFDLGRAFQRKQDQLLASLRGADIAAHPVTKGDDTELHWRAMLAEFLPKRYGVARAHVIDSQGRQSEQLDVVVHDTFFSPLLFEVGGAKFIPAESVYAVFEVKQVLNRKHLGAAADKVASVRALHRTSVPIPSAMGRLDSKDLARFSIIGGILASRSSWKPPLGEAFRRSLEELVGPRALDIGCALRDGGFERSATTAGAVQCSGAEVSLVCFVTRLLHRLQQMGTVPAIDYGAYGAAIRPTRRKASAPTRRR